MHPIQQEAPGRQSLSSLSQSQSRSSVETLRQPIQSMREHSLPVNIQAEQQSQPVYQQYEHNSLPSGQHISQRTYSEHAVLKERVTPSPPISHKTPSLTSTLNCDNSMEAVECVICEKLIQKDNFKQHLEDHRRRRLQKQSQPNESVSIRNQNEEE